MAKQGHYTGIPGHSGIEQAYMPTRGEIIRCRECTRRYFEIHGYPAIDNGYVELSKNPHFYADCMGQEAGE